MPACPVLLGQGLDGSQGSQQRGSALLHSRSCSLQSWAARTGLCLLTGVPCARGSAGSLCCPWGLLGKADGDIDIGSTVLLEVFPSFLLIVLPAYPAFLTAQVLQCPVPSPVPGIQNGAGSKVNLDGRQTQQQCQFCTGKGSPVNPGYNAI